MTEPLEHLSSVMSCYECPLLYECHGDDLDNPKNKYLMSPHPWRVTDRYAVGDCSKSSGNMTAGLIPVDDAMAHVHRDPYKRVAIKSLSPKVQGTVKLLRWMVKNGRHPELTQGVA